MYCTCEITKDEFGGCVLGADGKTCLACGKLISKETLQFLKNIAKSKTQGWDKEFEDKLYGNRIGINESIFFQELIIKYFRVDDKVKIKCKNGCIQIERIK